MSYNNVNREIKEDSFGNRPMPLMSWDIFSNFLDNQSNEARKLRDLDTLLLFHDKFNWSSDIQSIFADNDYKALILTDENQKILWVNDGFKAMTGYDKKYAVNKTPRFLQGTETKPATRKRIRKKIMADKPFEDIITNHRKDSTTYKCEVKIYPLKTTKTTHFIAFEKELNI